MAVDSTLRVLGGIYHPEGRGSWRLPRGLSEQGQACRPLGRAWVSSSLGQPLSRADGPPPSGRQERLCPGG